MNTQIPSQPQEPMPKPKKPCCSGKVYWVVLAVVFLAALGISLYVIFAGEVNLPPMHNMVWPEREAADETASWQTYRNEAGGYSVKYPDGWKAHSYSTDPENTWLGNEAQAEIAEKAQSRPDIEHIEITVYENSAGYSLEEWARISREAEDNPVGVGFGRFEDFSILGGRGQIGHFGCCMNYNQAALLSRGDKIYLLLGGREIFGSSTPEHPSNFYEYEEIFTQILSTFKFIK